MRELSRFELSQVHGASFKNSIAAVGCCITGMAIVGALGAAYLSPAVSYFDTGNKGLIKGLISDMADYVIAKKYGAYGIDSKLDLVGGIGGAIIGSIIGAAFFGAIS